jgi:hypothetical protein
MTTAENIAGAIVNAVNAGFSYNGIENSTGFDQSNNIASLIAWSSGLPSTIAGTSARLGWGELANPNIK